MSAATVACGVFPFKRVTRPDFTTARVSSATRIGPPCRARISAATCVAVGDFDVLIAVDAGMGVAADDRSLRLRDIAASHYPRGPLRPRRFVHGQLPNERIECDRTGQNPLELAPLLDPVVAEKVVAPFCAGGLGHGLAPLPRPPGLLDNGRVLLVNFPCLFDLQ